MRKIASHFVFCGKGDPVKFGIITLNGDSVVEVSSSSNNLTETEAVEFYPGVIMPGLVCAPTLEWIPANDENVFDTLNNKKKQYAFAGLSVQNIDQLSNKALSLIFQHDIRLVLINENNNQQQLFQLMQKLSEKMPELTMQQLVSIACGNGAEATGQSRKGFIAEGMAPGICHIMAFDFRQMNIQPTSRIKILIN